MMEAQVRVTPAIFMKTPSAMNRRFVCGYGKGDGFVMLFWNYNTEFSNGHGEIAEYYQKHHDPLFKATSGGFYMSNGHNNCNSENKRKFYLFGRSDTLGNPEKDKEAILKYAGENGLKFILGRTNFKNDEFNDEIGEYVGSDVLSALNKETC